MTDTTQNIKSQRRDAKGKLLPSIKDTPTLPILQAINAAFASIREHNAEVPPAVIVVGGNGKHGKSMNLGHFIPDKWESKTGVHEIAVSGESLANGAADVLSTLLHETAHALGATRGIQNTSRQGRFHNKRFKALAEELELEIAHDDKIGWSVTSLSEGAKKTYKTELAALRTALKAYRKPDSEKPTIKTTVRVECSCRGLTVPIKFFSDGGITCELCDEPFEEI
jgi:hypothetical protein